MTLKWHRWCCLSRVESEGPKYKQAGSSLQNQFDQGDFLPWSSGTTTSPVTKADLRPDSMDSSLISCQNLVCEINNIWLFILCRRSIYFYRHRFSYNHWFSCTVQFFLFWFPHCGTNKGLLLYFNNNIKRVLPISTWNIIKCKILTMPTIHNNKDS